MEPNQNQPTTPAAPVTANGANGEQPVAFDTQGRPLYLHPSQQPPTVESQTVHISRSLEPAPLQVPADIQARHEQSRRLFPQLNLSEGEYVISSVRRHPIGIVGIWFIAFGIIACLFALMAGVQSNGSIPGTTSSAVSAAVGGIIIISIFVIIGAMVASYVYNQNRFYLTNESVIQEIQTTIFNKNEQTVSLANIEDASYRQNGLFPMMFNFGDIRLSTEGDETTYRFTHVANPKMHIAVLNNAVESFKNGRPVTSPASHQDQPS